MSSTSQPPFVEGDYYEGAFGPTILLVLTSREAVAWLRRVFEGLAEIDVGSALRFDTRPEVEIGAAVTGLFMRRVERAPERHLERQSDGSLMWSCTAEGWRIASLLLEPLLNRPGHQYLTSETDDDAIVEITFGEQHPWPSDFQ